VILTNYKAGDDQKLKVDYKTLAGINPKIIYASVNGFGPESPRSAYDLILQAESGFMSMNGESGARPLKMPVALIDLMAGHQLKEAVLIALIKRHKTGSGSHISVSLFESAVASLANQATNWLIGKQVPKAGGSLHPNIAPYGEIFETRDKQLVTFAIGSNKQFRQLCDIIQNQQLCTDPHFSTNQQRVSNRSQLYPLIYDRVRKYNFAELYESCFAQNVPMAKIRDLQEVFSLSEGKHMLRKFAYDGKELSVVSSLAFRFHDERG
jgi:crotonobetainyl-CoA:carnitine CoA-transferase CaiB-like acyl-CoA transferase